MKFEQVRKSGLWLLAILLTVTMFVGCANNDDHRAFGAVIEEDDFVVDFVKSEKVDTGYILFFKLENKTDRALGFISMENYVNSVKSLVTDYQEVEPNQTGEMILRMCRLCSARWSSM